MSLINKNFREFSSSRLDEMQLKKMILFSLKNFSEEEINHINKVHKFFELRFRNIKTAVDETSE